MERSKFWKPFRSVRDHADTAGSDQLFTIIAGKFGILWPYTNLSSCPTSSSTACRWGSATQKPCLLGRLASPPLKETPFLPFQLSPEQTIYAVLGLMWCLGEELVEKWGWGSNAAHLTASPRVPGPSDKSSSISARSAFGKWTALGHPLEKLSSLSSWLSQRTLGKHWLHDASFLSPGFFW